MGFRSVFEFLKDLLNFGVCRFGAENTLAIPALWILWLVALDFFRCVHFISAISFYKTICWFQDSKEKDNPCHLFYRWKDRSKQRKVLRSLTKESEGGSGQDKVLKSINLEDKQPGNVVRRYKPRRGSSAAAANFSNRAEEAKLALEGPPSSPEKEDDDAFSVSEFFKDMCTIWNCLATQSNTKSKDVKANQKAIEDKSKEPPKDPQPLLPAIEHSGDKIEDTSEILESIEKEEGAPQLEVDNSESEDWSETSSGSGGEIVDYQSMIYLPEEQLKQIGKALAALHCWYCKVKTEYFCSK